MPINDLSEQKEENRQYLSEDKGKQLNYIFICYTAPFFFISRWIMRGMSEFIVAYYLWKSPSW